MVWEYYKFNGSPSTLSILFLLIVVLATYYVVSSLLAWYRLRHFTGPFSASFSYGWITTTVLSGRCHEIYTEQNDRYGHIVRIGPNELLTDDPSLIRKMSSARSSYRRGSWYEAMRINPYDTDLLTEMDTAKHDKLKAQVASGYAGRGNMDLEKDIDSQLAILTGVIRERYLSTTAGIKRFNFAKMAEYFTLDTITTIAYGVPWGYMRTEVDEYQFLQTMETAIPMIQTAAQNPYLRRILTSPIVMNAMGPKPTDTRGWGKFLGVAKSVVGQHLARSVVSTRDHGDILDEFIKHGLTPKQCEMEVPLQISAGADSTAVTIRGTMLYLLSSPGAYKKLKDETRAGIKQGIISRPIKSDEAKKLPYLQAVIYEGLRMQPGFTIVAGKQVPPEGDTINGKFVPGGTSIFHSIWSLLRNKTLFGEDADVFRPERFLECNEVQRGEMMRNVELVFGHGRWMCAGKTILFVELNKIFVELFRSFDFQIINPQQPWKMRNYGVITITDFWLRVTEDTLDS